MVRLLPYSYKLNEEISLQFLSTLKDVFAMVKGIKIELIEDVVAKVTVLPQEEKNWVKDFYLRMLGHSLVCILTLC